mmetsp:Transcript_89334/g.171294  ORF Transcript_89334/g.171294 Transcript_89334/m.171294 type:complete len:210 (+) Transcript_89334:2276-2905(+)
MAKCTKLVDSAMCRTSHPAQSRQTSTRAEGSTCEGQLAAGTAGLPRPAPALACMAWPRAAGAAREGVGTPGGYPAASAACVSVRSAEAALAANAAKEAYAEPCGPSGIRSAVGSSPSSAPSSPAAASPFPFFFFFALDFFPSAPSMNFASSSMLFSALLLCIPFSSTRHITHSSGVVPGVSSAEQSSELALQTSLKTSTQIHHRLRTSF